MNEISRDLNFFCQPILQALHGSHEISASCMPYHDNFECSYTTEDSWLDSQKVINSIMTAFYHILKFLISEPHNLNKVKHEKLDHKHVETISFL